GEPNSVVCHFASKPSGEMDEFSGSTSPTKLGDGQDERNTADISLAAWTTLNCPVPRKVTRPLKATRTPSLPSGSGAFASTMSAPLQTASGRSASTHGTHAVGAPSTVTLSDELRPVSRVLVPKAIAASLQMKRPSLSATTSRRRASVGTTNAPFMSSV